MGCEALPALSNLACVLRTLSFTVSHSAVIRTPGTPEKLSTSELPRSPVPMTPMRMVSLGWNGISATLLPPEVCARPRDAPSDASPARLNKSRREELSITLPPDFVRQAILPAGGLQAGAGGPSLVEDLALPGLAGPRGEAGRRDPGDRGNRDANEQLFGEGDLHAILLENQEDDGCTEGTDHGHNLTPRRDAPPEPAQQVQQAGSRAHRSQQVEAVLGGSQQEDHTRRSDEQQHGGAAPGPDVVFLGGLGVHEAAVKIVHQVGGAPVEVGEDGRRVSGDQTSQHEPYPSGR